MSAKPSESSSSVWFATGIIKNPSERIVKVGGIVPKLAIWLLDMIQILPLRKSHIDSIIELNVEFDTYLSSLSNTKTNVLDVKKKRIQILENAFGKRKIFSGYVAKVSWEIVGFTFYHYGFDPDEMEGKVIYMFELFVSEKARGKWVWKALIEKLQSHEDSLGLYFAVWKKNPYAIEFYQKLGANWVEDVPFMKLMK